MLKAFERALGGQDLAGKTVRLKYGDDYTTIVAMETEPKPGDTPVELNIGLAVTSGTTPPSADNVLNPVNSLYDQLMCGMGTDGQGGASRLWIQTTGPNWLSMSMAPPDPSRTRTLKVWRTSTKLPYQLAGIQNITERAVDLSKAAAKMPTAVAPADAAVAPADAADSSKSKKKKKPKKASAEKEKAKEEEEVQADAAEVTSKKVEEPPKKSEEIPKKKSKKDPNAPKKNLTAFILFQNAMRPEVKKKHPDMSFGDMGTLLGLEWRVLGDKQKQKWTDKAKAEKARYREEKRKYDAERKRQHDVSEAEEEVQEVPPEVAETASKKKAKKDPHAPKRNITAYIMFQSSRRPEVKVENPDMKFADVARMLGEEWRNLSEKDKKKWTDKANEDKARYLDEKEKYDAEHKDDEVVVEEVQNPDKKKKRKDPNKPKKALGAYMFFSNWRRAEVVAKNPDASFGEIGTLVGNEWRALSEDDKKKWQDQAAEDKERYIKAMENYHPEETEDEEPDKKKRKKRDPYAPKRAMSAYMFFSNSRREELIKKNPDASFGQIGKMTGEEWRKVNEEDKKKWQDMATADKERWEKEKQEYESKDSSDEAPPVPKSTQKKSSQKAKSSAGAPSEEAPKSPVKKKSESTDEEPPTPKSPAKKKTVKKKTVRKKRVLVRKKRASSLEEEAPSTPPRTTAESPAIKSAREVSRASAKYPESPRTTAKSPAIKSARGGAKYSEKAKRTPAKSPARRSARAKK